MAVAHSIFTLDGWFQLFWAAFDMPMTGVPLKVALGYKKIGFWVFKKNNQASGGQGDGHNYFFEMAKNQICAILMHTTAKIGSKAVQNN